MSDHAVRIEEARRRYVAALGKPDEDTARRELEDRIRDARRPGGRR